VAGREPETVSDSRRDSTIFPSLVTLLEHIEREVALVTRMRLVISGLEELPWKALAGKITSWQLETWEDGTQTWYPSHLNRDIAILKSTAYIDQPPFGKLGGANNELLGEHTYCECHQSS
jgi:hypothetical protein